MSARVSSPIRSPPTPPTWQRDTGAQVRDNALSKARFEFRWKDQFNLSFDPERAFQYYKDSAVTDGEYCTMCGPNFCAMRLSKDLHKENCDI